MNSSTQLRVATATVLIPVITAAIWWGPSWFLTGLAAIVAALALGEFFALGERIGFHAYRLWTYLIAFGVFAQQWYAAQAASLDTLSEPSYRAKFSVELVLVLFVFGAALIAVGGRRPLADGVASVSVSAAGLLVIVIPFSAVIRIHAVDAVGRQLLLFTLALVWVGDSAAYFAGHAFGRFRMTPHLSPNKTWEGAAANLVGALLVATVFGFWMKVAPVHLFAMAILGSVAGQIGDLFESAFKRSAGAKDSGTLLPGHGGMLDRIDALILAAPAVWYYFQWFVMRRV